MKPSTAIFRLLFLAFSVFSFSCNRDNLPNTQLGNWVQSAAIGDAPRSNAASFVIGDVAYVGLGYNESVGSLGRLKDFWKFSVATGWTQIEDFPGAPRSNATAFSIGNYGYVGVGYDVVSVYKDFYRYDPALPGWTRKADFHDPRYDAVGFGLQGKGYIGTGYNGYSRNDFYQYEKRSCSLHIQGQSVYRGGVQQ
jgi:N-acetylneuraminic acid mutarotase